MGGSKPEKYQFRLRKTRFFTKSAFSKNIVKSIDFQRFFGSQNGEKSLKNGVEKHVILKHRIRSVFFRIFVILARFWEAQGPPKIDKKSKKLHPGRFWNASKIFDRFGDSFGRVWEGFGKVLGGFWQNF